MKGMLAQALDRATFDNSGSVKPLASATEAILKSHGGLATPMETIRQVFNVADKLWRARLLFEGSDP
jgi:hypothetical protein